MSPCVRWESNSFLRDRQFSPPRSAGWGHKRVCVVQRRTLCLNMPNQGLIIGGERGV